MPIQIPSIIVIVTALFVACVLLFYRPLVVSSSWRATITPLASIMGSGFLVCAPLLYANVGNYAVFAMAVLLCLAYGVGSVIRFNIRYGEALFKKQSVPIDSNREEHRLHTAHRDTSHGVKAGEATEFLEKTSHIVLAVAYCISVSYYLQLLAGFALQPFSFHKIWFGKMMVTLILTGIGVVGTVRGLKGIERMERTVVGINLSMIAALIASLVYHNLTTLDHGAWRLHHIAITSR